MPRWNFEDSDDCPVEKIKRSKKRNQYREDEDFKPSDFRRLDRRMKERRRELFSSEED